jgi:hypothetical protein
VIDKIKSPFGMGSALLKFIGMKKASNELVTAFFGKQRLTYG